MADRYQSNRGRDWPADDENSYPDDRLRAHQAERARQAELARRWERERQWERTRQWRAQGPNQKWNDPLNYPQQPDRQRYSRGYSSTDWDYGPSYQRASPYQGEYPRWEDDDNPDSWRYASQADRAARMPGQIYNQGWYNWDYDNELDADEPRGSRSFNRNQYSAGMAADDDEDRLDYDYHPTRYENLNYRRGDIGYDSEGAFYQDLDEPINSGYGLSWQQRQLMGLFSGFGPQNYTRSDQRIEEDVCEMLTQHGRIDAREIVVEIHDGVATLKGSVPDRDMKRRAEAVVEQIFGVNDVRNEIKVRQPERNQYHDWTGSREFAEDDARVGSQQARLNDVGETWESKWTKEAQQGPAGDTNLGAGLTSAGATSLSGLEKSGAAQEKKNDLRTGMEVIDKQGKIVGQVKELRQGDFLVDREMARDVYVPYDGIRSVGAQVMLDIQADEVDLQNWEKPPLI